jgi:hypothetical protein
MSVNGFDQLKPPGWQPLQISSRIYDGCDCYPWHEVFAWWPVRTVNGRYVWLRKIYKRKFWVVWGTGFHMEPYVEYGDLFDILAGQHND